MLIPAVNIFAVALLATVVAPARTQTALSSTASVSRPTPNGPGANDQADPFPSGIPPNVSPTTILANGDPPLTESMVNVYNNLEARNLRAGKQAWVKRLQARDAAEAAAVRYKAFIKRDANSVSEQELAAAAKDAFSVAQYHRSEEGEQSPLAAGWDQAGRAVNVGKEAYVRKMTAQAANAPMTAAEFVREYNRETMRYVTSMNIIANMSSTGYHYGIR